MNDQNLFGGLLPAPKRKSKTYEEFVDKFKPKLTTDDCYTPPAVYDAVMSWVRQNCNIDGCKILRPFYPGGDYQAVEYQPNDVVVDNPPFSIITQIVRYYTENGILFFLFAPHLTLFQPGRFCTSIIAEAKVVYENGANVNTSFVSNLFGDIAFMTAPELRRTLASISKTGSRALPVYEYPPNVVTVSRLSSLARAGIDFAVRQSSVQHITKLDSQSRKSIFGGGYLVSDKVAAERLAAERLAAERRQAIYWSLSPRELNIISELE